MSLTETMISTTSPENPMSVVCDDFFYTNYFKEVKIIGPLCPQRGTFPIIDACGKKNQLTKYDLVHFIKLEKV